MDFNEELEELNKSVDRLNFLYYKSNSLEGLTDDEREEQGLLREKYIKFFRNNIEY